MAISSKKKNPGKLLARLCLVLFAIYVVYNFVVLQIQIKEKNDELLRLEAEIYSQNIINQQLEENVNAELSDEEIAEIAREKLGYSLPGERIFIDITGK